MLNRYCQRMLDLRDWGMHTYRTNDEDEHNSKNMDWHIVCSSSSCSPTSWLRAVAFTSPQLSVKEFYGNIFEIVVGTWRILGSLFWKHASICSPTTCAFHQLSVATSLLRVDLFIWKDVLDCIGDGPC